MNVFLISKAVSNVIIYQKQFLSLNLNSFICMCTLLFFTYKSNSQSEAFCFYLERKLNQKEKDKLKKTLQTV